LDEENRQNWNGLSDEEVGGWWYLWYGWTKMAVISSKVHLKVQNFVYFRLTGNLQQN
jgi:hypothetical protein